MPLDAADPPRSRRKRRFVAVVLRARQEPITIIPSELDPMHRRSPIAFSTAFAAVVGGGCGQASPSSAKNHGSGSNETVFRTERVTWDQNGIIDRRWGIEGSWYAYDDCGTERPSQNFPCTDRDPELSGPDGIQGWATSASKVCMRGTVPRVELKPDKMLAYEYQWGAGMGFNLGAWNPDLETRDAYDATAHGIIGFMFDVTQGTPGPPAPATLRISLPMPATEAESHFITIAPPSLDRGVMFDEVEQGFWVTVPTEFRPQTIQGIKFDVYTNNQAPKDYDFCVGNFRVVCAGECIP
jgi:hypothetical protein